MVSPRVVSLHIHSKVRGGAMLAVEGFELIAGDGIVQDKRYFGRRSSNGQPSKRQVTLIEREQIAEHAQALGRAGFPPGAVLSNIETEGIQLVGLEGKMVEIGSARLLIGKPRDPCEKMDRLAPGLRALMENDRQGVLAQVVTSGTIRPGDPIRVV